MKNTIKHEPMRIAGKKVDAENKIDVLYPYTNEIIGTVPAGTAEHAKEALNIASNYQPKLTRYERQQILQKTAEELVRRKDEISDVITYELGISKQDSLYEVGRAFDVFSLTAQLCILDDGEIFSCDLTPHGKARKIFTIREPLRAISAITPFNHPLNMVAHKIAPSIATNNCTVCKQTELTPMTAMLLADVLYDSGLPPEMFSVVTGWPQDIGLEMIKNPNIDLITFTGSVGVGKYIAEQAGYKRTVLELGGNDPLIVLNDLSDDDLKKAVELAVTGATKNSGQRCTAVKRILCQNKIADKFVAMALERAKQITYGDPMDLKTDLGTVVNTEAAELFDKRVSMAEAEGAKVLYHPGRNGALLPPIVVDNVNPKSELVLEETFGPVAPVYKFTNDDEVIKMANDTPYGLASYFYSRDIGRIWRVAEALEYGIVSINNGLPTIPEVPFGGVKESGMGREGSRYGLDDYLIIKYISMGGI